MSDMTGIITTIWQGFSMVGNALTALIRLLLTQIGLQVPDAVIQVASIIMLGIVAWKASGIIIKAALVGLIFCVASGLLTTLHL